MNYIKRYFSVLSLILILLVTISGCESKNSYTASGINDDVNVEQTIKTPGYSTLKSYVSQGLQYCMAVSSAGRKYRTLVEDHKTRDWSSFTVTVNGQEYDMKWASLIDTSSKSGFAPNLISNIKKKNHLFVPQIITILVDMPINYENDGITVDVKSAYLRVFAEDVGMDYSELKEMYLNEEKGKY